MYGLKNVPQNETTALECYKRAATIGYEEAKMALDVNYHRMILQKFHKNGACMEVITLEHLGGGSKDAQAKKWILMDQVAATNYWCSF